MELFLRNAGVINNLEIYFEQFLDKYPLDAQEFINEFFSAPWECSYDIIHQICCETNAIPDEVNRYKNFTDFIEKKYGLNRNILEIGGGFYPSLGKEIRNRQLKLNRGSITVYDPLLVTTMISKIKLYKELWRPHINKMTKYDHVISIFPAGATEMVVKEANRNNIEFTIGMCGCSHGPNPMSHDEWYNYIYRLAKNTAPDNMKINFDSMRDIDDTDVPIISSVKVK